MKKLFGVLVVAISLLSVFLFVSCEKEITQTNMIIRNWNLVSKTVAGANVALGCEINSKWNFKTGGTYVITDTCGDPKSGTWVLAEDGKTLTLNGVTAYKVISNSILKLEIEMQVAQIGLIRWTFN